MLLRESEEGLPPLMAESQRELGAGNQGLGGWLPGMDSNHDSRLQRPLSYH